MAACDTDSMTTTPSIEELSRTIERVVREHIEASRAAVSAAVQRAFEGNQNERSESDPGCWLQAIH